MKSLRFILLLALVFAGSAYCADPVEPAPITAARDAINADAANYGASCTVKIVDQKDPLYVLEVNCDKFPKICYFGMDVSDPAPLDTAELLGCKPKIDPKMKEI